MTHRVILATLGWVSLTAAAAGTDLSITARPYLTGGLFTRPVLPQEGEAVTVTVRATCEGQLADVPKAKLTLVSQAGKTVAEQTLALEVAEKRAEATWTWTAGASGLYTLRAQLDPAGAVAETNEDNNAAELTLPVLAKGRGLHFAWYRETPDARWSTCVTSAGDATQQARLHERGLIPLNWEYGGMSWSYYDKKNAEENPEDEARKLEALFYGKFTRKGLQYGCGIDECGGYPGTWKERASIASMKALVQAKKAMPDRFFAVWNGGALNPKTATYYRMGADLLLLETYVFRAVAEGLGTEEIYELIHDRLSPVIRSRDMILPAYGNWCHTLIALDTSERPDCIRPGEMENVVRYVRRICPEMRGIAWYNGGYGGYGLKRTLETDKIHQAVLACADRLCLDYYIKPCVTLMPHSLWPEQKAGGGWTLTAAVSNIGGVDSGPVSVAFLVDGKVVGRQTATKVPAGPNRLRNRVLLEQPVELKPGLHALEARIVDAGTATPLDVVVRCSRLIR